MEAVQVQNAIRVNMRGFLPKARKKFVLTENKTGNAEFTVTLIHGEFVEHTVIFRGRMTTERDEDGREFQVGDFSEVTDDGDYYITAGGYQSRQFVIYDGAYDICQRMMLEYYTYQRCGHPLGWNGKCHTDDGYIKETGERVDLSGGYHQSCDLRKSPGGVSIGVLGMMRYAMTDGSEWGKLLVADEVGWACDYFVKTIQESGAMYNTMNSPFGWGGRIFYESAAPSSAQWNVTSILALGYSYFKERDPKRAKKYLDASLLSYGYMTSERRSAELYTHPDKPQRGFDPDNFYLLCQKNSTADRLYAIAAACDLYKATGDERFSNDIKAQLPTVLEKLLDGKLAYVMLEEFVEGRTVLGNCTYCWAPAYPTALVNAYEVVGDIFGLGEKIRKAADAICDYAESNVWGEIKFIRSDSDLDIKADMPKPGVPYISYRETFKDSLVTYGEANGQKYYYIKSGTLSPLVANFGVFLAKASKALSEPRYADCAQWVLDSFLGTNRLDASRLRGIGYNHVQHKAFGQFFPSTPFIPGAVQVGFKSLDVYSSFAEYDMPCVGNLMHLITEISELYK